MALRQRDRRQYAEDDDDEDARTRFQHDRDRILYSSAFRRLAGVTQVVGAGEGHVFHNRLTHTLRVAQVSRRLTERLRTKQPDLAEKAALDADVAESAALAHDLGHPPFGHVGETELDRLLRDVGGVKDGFEGNAQSFRIITRLALRKERQRGLNLTRATQDAVLKYPWLRDLTKAKRTNKEWRKFGAYRADETRFDWVRRYEPAKVLSVEATIMDWADDITYAVHDVEDFYRAGFVPLDKLLTSSRERLAFTNAVMVRWRDEGGRPTGFPDSYLIEKFDAILDLISALQVPLRRTFEGSERQRWALRRAASLLIGRYVTAASLVQDRQGRVSLQRSRTSTAEVEMLKQLTWHYVIRRPSLASQQVGQRRVIENLFKTYLRAMDDGPNRRSRLDVLPVWAREQLARDERNEPKPYDLIRARVAADIVCWMSEQQALDLHTRTMGVSLGSITDLM
jgi:dGTPase